MKSSHIVILFVFTVVCAFLYMNSETYRSFSEIEGTINETIQNYQVESEFVNFISQYRRNYGTDEEYQYRLSIFQDVFYDIQIHNSNKDSTYKKAINQFSDMTKSEFDQMKGLVKQEENTRYTSYKFFSTEDLPTSVDWRENGAVTQVKNQGSCGSCYSFSAIGAIEGAYQIQSGNLVSLSEQQFVDCSKAYGNLGCMGGLMDYCFKYSMDEKVMIESEADYPYKGFNLGGNCNYQSDKGVVQVTGFADVIANSSSQLLAAASHQPVSVAIEADQKVFQSYSSGIISSVECGVNLDHGVLLVGYGTEGTTDYWILKNSWGAAWGENGFFRILRQIEDGPGICGLQMGASFPYV